MKYFLNPFDGRTYVLISNCPVCKGAVFKYASIPWDPWMDMFLYQCYHCGRIFVRVNGKFELWTRNGRKT